MDAAYVFGTLGNLSDALVDGWSIEDHFAWAVGAESRLVLPLPTDEAAYTLRFDVHPFTLPGRIDRQRLTIWQGRTVLLSLEMTARQTLVVPLPAELTRKRRHLDLILTHPDAARPCDHQHGNDSRLLALCFHSVSLMQTRTSDTQVADTADSPGLEPIHGLIAGDTTAQRIGEIIGKLPSLRGRFGIRTIDLSQDFEQGIRHLPADTLRTAHFCWLNSGIGSLAARDRLLRQLPDSCIRHSFYTPSVQALWPLQAQDPRAVPEAGRYHPARYPIGDRLAQALRSMNMPDDVVALMYEISVEQEPLDLDALFAADLAGWHLQDRKSDIKLADFIASEFRSSRLFLAPSVPGPALLREMIRQVLAASDVGHLATDDVLSAELDHLQEGYVGWRQELPVHKRVARHFGLGWWSPELKYRWQNNRYTAQEYILDYIRWTQWRL